MAKKSEPVTEVADAKTGEIIEAPAKDMSLSQRATLASGIVVSVKKVLQLPVLSNKAVGVPLFMRIEEAVRHTPGKTKDGKEILAPATVTTVTNLEDGRRYTFLVPTVVQGIFDDEYPNSSYVGKCFSMINMGKREGKRHKDMQVVEITLEG